MTLDYWNELAKQTLLVSSLLSGFSIAVMANLLVSDKETKLANSMLKASTLASGCFLVSVFAMVHIVMTTTPGGYIENVTINDFQIARIIGMLAFMIGLISLTTIIALSGWTKSKKVGRFTTIVGVLTLLLVFVTMTRLSL